jgi:hypothetical protein
MAASTEYQREVAESDGIASTDDNSADLAGFLPLIDKRLERLAAMGAQLDQGADRLGGTGWTKPRTLFGWLVGVPFVVILMAIVGVLLLMLLGCVAALIYLALMFEMLLLAPPVLIVHTLLR